MKRNLQGMLLSGLLLLALSGCVASVPEGARSTGVAVETVPTSGASVKDAEAFIAGDGLTVAGTVRRLHEVRLPGHVDVFLCGPKGLLEKKSVAVPGLASKRRGVMDLAFRTRFERIPPEGSKILVRYHAPPFDEGSRPGCG